MRNSAGRRYYDRKAGEGQTRQSSNAMPQTQDRAVCLAAYAHPRTTTIPRQQISTTGSVTDKDTQRAGDSDWETQSLRLGPAT